MINIAKLSKKNREIKQKKHIPKTVQKTIPYKAFYENGIIEDRSGRFSRTYRLVDVNFTIVSKNEQSTLFQHYEEFLNMFSPETYFQISIINRKIDKSKVYDSVLLKKAGDGLDIYREEVNDILISKMQEGQKNLVQEKYLTVSINADNIESAVSTFARLDTEIASAMKRINNAETFPISMEERISLLHDIYNPNAELPLSEREIIDGQEASHFTIDLLKKYRVTTKDVIGPSSITFNADYFKMDDVFGRVLFMDKLPTTLSTKILSELTGLPCGMLVSIYHKPVAQDQALGMVNRQLVNINSNIVDHQRKAARRGYSADILPANLQSSREEADELREDLTSKNQKMYFATLVVTLFADTLEELNKNTKTIISNAGKFLVSLKKLFYQQEQGFNTTLPLALNEIYAQRLLTTESAALFIPFTAQEFSHDNGMYYGINAVSRNLILYNRTNAGNANGVILGTSGSGKSFAAKREMLNVALTTDADIFIIDPEREYAAMAELLGGEVVKIAPGSKNHINPFDMDLDYADEDDPITLKSDFICSLCETMVGSRYGLSPIQKSVIDRCVRRIYTPYIEYMSTVHRGKASDFSRSPTLKDFYNELLSQPEIEAQNLALALEIFCDGSLDTFSYHTNVDITNRFVVYDIKDLGTQMKELGLQVCLNDIWNRTIANKKRHKRTWFYIDEFYLLTQTDTSAQFLQQIFKRARKWGGVPTGITQNVEDLLSSREARGIISNCDFIMMLNQAPLDGQELAAMLNISPTQMSYITNVGVGQGLLYANNSIIPFIDKYPTDTKTFKVMTTKMEDLIARGEKK